MSDPIGAGLEGLVGGLGAGLQFRTGLQERKRRLQLASDLATLKQMEEQRKAAHEAAEEARAGAVEQRAATTFAGQQADLARARALREAVGQRLGAGDVDIPAEGVLHGVATGTAPQYVPLPPGLRETEQTGQLLGGRTEAERLILGSRPDLAKELRGLSGAGGGIQRVTDPVTGEVFAWDPRTNTMTPTTMRSAPGAAAPGATGAGAAVTPQAPARLGVKPPPPKIAYDAEGNAYEVTPGVGGAPTKTTPLARMGKPLTSKERQDAANATVALRDHQHLMELEKNPQTLQEVAQFMSVPAIGKLVPWGLAGGVSELIRKARTAGLSPAAQDYLKSLYDYASLMGPTRYGRNFRNEVLLEQLWSDFGAGQFGITPQGIKATQLNRERGAHALRAQAGPRAAAQVSRDFPPDTAVAPAPRPAINPRFDPRVHP